MLLILIARLFAASSFAQQDSIAIYYAQGVNLFFGHDGTAETLLEAQRQFNKVLSIDKTNASALAYLGLIAIEQDDTATARAYFMQALAFDSTCAEAHIGVGRLYCGQLQWDAGIEKFREAIRWAPTNIFARRELVGVLLHAGEDGINEKHLQEAIPHLEFLIAADSNDRDAHYELAQSYEYVQQWRNALRHYCEVLRIGQLPKDKNEWVYEVRFDVARMLENLGQYEEALWEYQHYLSDLEKRQADEQTLWIVRGSVKRMQKRLMK